MAFMDRMQDSRLLALATPRFKVEGRNQFFVERFTTEPGLAHLLKFNPNHDKSGRFSAGDGGGGDSSVSMGHTDVVQAYADANHPIEEQDKWNSVRNLKFLSDHKMSVAEAQNTMSKAVPNGYNDYSTKRVFNVLSKHEGLQIQLGREGSPVMYVHGPKETLSALVKSSKKMKASEADIIDHDYKTVSGKTVPASTDKPVLRLWWD